MYLIISGSYHCKLSTSVTFSSRSKYKTLIETTPNKHISQIYTCQSWLPLGAFCQTTIPARLYQFLKAKSKMKRTMQNDELLIKHLYS